MVGGKQKILIVDDNRQFSHLLEMALTSAGYTVTCVYDGAEALKLINTGTAYDLVLLDIIMPKIDGVALLGQIEAPRMGALKLVVMSNLFEGSVKEKLKRYPILGYLDKGALLPQEMVKKVQEWIG